MIKNIKTILNNATKLEKITFWIIVGTAAFLRLSTYFELSFYNDELSALVRVQEAEFTDLIAYGENVNDEHPMLIQGFLFVWTSIVGFKEWIVKLPFLITSFITLFLLFELGTKWTKSIGTGLMLMAFFSVMQLHVAYSHSIRMYISGFLFILILVKHLWIWLEESEGKIDKHYIIACIFFALSGYNHHIGLMAVTLVWFTGFFFLSKTKRKFYLFIPIICLFLYAPILPMTYQQVFGYKGLSWMGKPAPGVLKRFTLYLLHFEWYYVAFTTIPFFIGLILRKFPSKKVTLSVSWLIVSYLMIYYYTMYAHPIFENHLFFFAVPFTFLFIFAVISKLLGNKWSVYYTLILLVLGFYSLVFKRHHLEYYPKKPYGELKKDMSYALNTLSDQDSLLVIHNLNTRYTRFYFKSLKDQPIKFIELNDSLGARKKKIPLLELKKYANFKKAIVLNAPYHYLNYLSNDYNDYQKPWFGLKQTKYFLERKDEKIKTSNPKWTSILPDSLQELKLKKEWGPKTILKPNQSSSGFEISLSTRNTEPYLIVNQIIEKETSKTVFYGSTEIKPSSDFKHHNLLLKTNPKFINQDRYENQLYIWNNNVTTLDISSFKQREIPNTATILDKEESIYYPEIKMPFDPYKSYGFSVTINEEAISEEAYVYAIISCNDTTFQFYGKDLPKTKKNNLLVGTEINSVYIDNDLKGCEAKFGIYNKGKGLVSYTNPQVKTYDRNYLYYGTVEKIEPKD